MNERETHTQTFLRFLKLHQDHVSMLDYREWHDVMMMRLCKFDEIIEDLVIVDDEMNRRHLFDRVYRENYTLLDVLEKRFIYLVVDGERIDFI